MLTKLESSHLPADYTVDLCSRNQNLIKIDNELDVDFYVAENFSIIIGGRGYVAETLKQQRLCGGEQMTSKPKRMQAADNAILTCQVVLDSFICKVVWGVMNRCFPSDAVSQIHTF